MGSALIAGTPATVRTGPAISSGPGRSSDEPSPSILQLAGFECSLATTSLDELEAIGRRAQADWLAERFRREEGTEEAALLSTCCRRELLVLVRCSEDLDRWRSALPGPARAWREHPGRSAVLHLFRVAGGRESLVVGEKEVREQVREAGHSALSRHRVRIVRDLLREAAEAADRAAPSVPPSRSIAAVAATRVLELSGHPFPRVLVVGAGAVGRQVTEMLAPSARVTLAYHQHPPDEGFLRSTGARTVQADALAPEIALSDAVVTAAKSGRRCLGAVDLPVGRPLVLVDLGVPRNVDPAVRALAGIRLLDLSDLRPLVAPPPDPAVEEGLRASADRFSERLERMTREPWVASTRRRAEAARVSELAIARPFLGPLSPEQQLAVDRLTRRLVDRLLRAPTERLRKIPANDEGDRLRRFALELLDPDPTGP